MRGAAGHAVPDLLECGIGAPLLLIPGALTSAAELRPVAEVLGQAYRVGVLDVAVPAGWGGAPFDLTTAGMRAARALKHLGTESQPALIVGESAGALIALDAARQWDGRLQLVLIDPPLAPAKLWHVRANMQRAIAQVTPAVAAFLADYGRVLFGYGQEGVAAEPLWHEALSGFGAPVLVLTGEVPLWPVRQTPEVPCCLDAQDVAMLKLDWGTGIELTRLSGADHLLLRRRPEECLRLIADWQRRCIEKEMTTGAAG